MIKNRIKKLEQGGGYVQPLVIIASSPAQQAELVQECINEHGRPPDKIVKLIAVSRCPDTGEPIHRFGGEIVPG